MIFTGTFSLIWFTFWMIFANNSPEECSKMSEAERRYIQTATQELDTVKVIYTVYVLNSIHLNV